ncbi:MAG: antibiotic biosynthesis monooxygenase [Mesorhizobium sp.]|nr:MAG: antibiotic biosynthesis monooxygenase [Mesorhizobium sp.]RWM46539.1 MAG: antibiotic biosynthesis monooxygenase [Mesorhizobium sp.]RWM50416.1 MAG: antibiotic biosynthesis monooxygenase [Mesorhizobium sp.]RWM55491.1 MAG: antibiotic biosynthesis monooxygenase [Mesorhizobium sp.]RWM77515.1 MAG: antibiotic biosynthesis monooxygenase [Mesorhizobium sp.]
MQVVEGCAGSSITLHCRSVVQQLRASWNKERPAALDRFGRNYCPQFRHQSSEVSMTHIRADNQPVTQITIVDSEPDKQSEALSVMAERARFMARQPGFISISLHRSLDGRRIVNYVQWQNRDLLRSAHQAPEFRREWGHFDQLTDEIDPNLYEVTEVIESGQ